MAIWQKCLACNLFRDECRGSEHGCGKWAKINFEAEPISHVAGNNLMEAATQAGPAANTLLSESH